MQHLLLVTLLAAPSFCGTIGEKISPKIINGEDAILGQFPFHVSVQAGTLHGCGGTIIAPTWVVTVAHCMQHPISKYRIVTGIIDFEKNDPEPQIVKAVEKIIHPEFQGRKSYLYYDIGLFRLEEPLRFNDYVKPIKLPAAGFETVGEAEIVGWGCTGKKERKPQQILQTAKVPILPHAQCKAVYKKYCEEVEICAGGNEKGICFADSGGVLVQNGLFIGVASHGYVPWTKYPSVFVKVSSCIDFISKHVKLSN